MSFQKCPVCEGSGQVQRFGLSPVCHVCSGHGIIDEVTGHPPLSNVVSISKSLSDAPQNSDSKIKKPYRHVEGGPIPYGAFPRPKDMTIEEKWENMIKKINS